MALEIGMAAVGASTFLLCCLLGFIWWLDRYEREPLWLVVLVFVWGGLGGTLLGASLNLVVDVAAALVLPAEQLSRFSTVIVAPMAEEFTKGLIFLALFFIPFFRKELDNETDGLIYGAAVGLGFAVIENLLYFIAVSGQGLSVLLGVVVVRTLFTSLVHTISSSLLGFSVGLVRHRRLFPFMWIVPVLGYLAAVLNHSWWNFALSLGQSGQVSDDVVLGTVGLALMTVVGMALFMFLLTQLSLYREKRIIKRYLLEEAQAGVLPVEHVRYLASWRGRRRTGWLPHSIPRHDYIKAATLLAFRCHQAEKAAPRFQEKYRRQAQGYRAQVRDYLARAS